VDRLIKQGSVEFNEETSIEERLQYMEMLSVFARACFVSPRIAPPDREPNEDEITIEMVTLEDRQFVFQFMGQPARALRNFRQFQTEPLEHLRTLQSDGEGAERGDADQPVGGGDAGDAV
jgi:hypothetical protein